MMVVNIIATAYNRITTTLERMLHMNKIKREEKIYLQLKNDNGFEVKNSNKDVVYLSDDDYSIYFKNANLKSDATIDGRYLGIADNSLMDGYCRDVKFNNGKWIKDGGGSIKTARMMAVNNKTGATIIIE
jgi:hypothetical protein